MELCKIKHITCFELELNFGCSLAMSLRYSKAAVIIQKTYRMVVVRQLFLMIRQATITIQAFTRGTLARRRYRLVSI